MKCPNCGQSINENDEKCPHCGFNLKKFREEFFTDKHVKAPHEDKQTATRMTRRAIYEDEFSPKNKIVLLKQ